MARTFNGNVANYLHAVGLKYNFGTNGAVVFRAKTSVDGGMIVMGRRNLIAGAGFAISRDPDFNALVLSAYGDGDKFKFASFDKWPADGSYHSFILNKSGTSWTLYIDVATAIATETASPATTPDPDLFIGALNDLAAGGAVAPFNGSIDDVAFFAEPLGTADRAAYLGGAAASTLEAVPLGEHHWPMDNAAATGETDDFGSADLTEVGTVGFEGAGDTTPTLTSPSGTGGLGVCSGSVSTNEGNGTLYAVATASATAPSAAQVKAGQDHTGSAALRVVSQSVSGTGAQTIASGAITGGAGTRYLHFMHEDAAANQSSVVSSSGFTVTAAATAAPLSCPELAGLTGFSGVVLSAAAPGGGTTVLTTFTSLSFDGSGNASVSVAGLSQTVGAVRYVMGTQSDGNLSPGTNPRCFQGPVALT